MAGGARSRSRSREPVGACRAGAGAGPRCLIGFDFDCTLTVRHFFKVFAHGYLKGDMTAHPHCAAFAAFCKQRKLPAKVGPVPPGLWQGNPMGAVLEAFCEHAGEAAFRQLFREVFCGGEARIRLVADWLDRMGRAGVEFAVVTAGVSTSALRGLAAVPEWRHHFPPSRVWDVSQARHRTGSVMAMKAFILRELRPDARRIVLVDDSLERDEPPAWALEVAQVEMLEGQLQYEGAGMSAESLAALESLALKG